MDFSKSIDLLSEFENAIFGINGLYISGGAETSMIFVPEQEWSGTVDGGDIDYNVNRTLWCMDAIIPLPKVGDRIEIFRPGGATELYKVINHDKNTCYTFKHGGVSRNRIIVCTERIKSK